MNVFILTVPKRQRSQRYQIPQFKFHLQKEPSTAWRLSSPSLHIRDRQQISLWSEVITARLQDCEIHLQRYDGNLPNIASSMKIRSTNDWVDMLASGTQSTIMSEWFESGNNCQRAVILWSESNMWRHSADRSISANSPWSRTGRKVAAARPLLSSRETVSFTTAVYLKYQCHSIKTPVFTWVQYFDKSQQNDVDGGLNIISRISK